MNKLELLFDSTTIINLPFMIKLFKRYLKSSIVIFIIIVLACTSLYFFQQEIYWTSISFSDASDSSEPAIGGIAGSLIGEKKGGMRATDILNLRSSIDFNRKVASRLLTSEFYPKLRFDLNYLGVHVTDSNSFKKICRSNQECLIKEIVKRLPKLYQITDKDRTGANFSLEVSSLDNLTANVLLNEISKTISESRVEAVRYKLKEQEKVDTSILIEKKKEIDVINFYELQDEADRLNSELKEIQSKVDHQTNVITSVQDKMANAEASYQLSKKVSGKKVNFDTLNSEMRIRELKEKTMKLNSDIIALEDVSREHSIKDSQILAQLKKEMEAVKKKLKLLGDGNSQINLDQFVKQNDEKIYIRELEYNVIKDQMHFAKQNYEELIIKKKDILGQKIKVEQSIEILKPSVEFIKSMEIRIEQSKLKSMSANPDVRFDRYSGAPEPTKKIGLILILGYLVILQCVAAVSHLLIRFYFDNNIYDEDDLRAISANLKIIGNGPSYE